ncbi:hypothetical protein [Nisaea sp.]
MAAAVKFSDALVGLGLKTCKRLAYESPGLKLFGGVFVADAPEAE